uniref:Putative ixoderin b5 n=1 Tax=Ixodes ricinus TaxID=34613 RepID=A0A6B0V7K1_IXORI
MFVAFLFIPVVAGNVFMEGSIPNIPEITERQYGTRKTYMLFDPCNTNKPGNRRVSCSQLKMRGFSVKAGIYAIYLLGKAVDVACDMASDDGGGWTVIQSRTEYEIRNDNFEKEFQDYERGFTTQGGAFWIGLDNLHALTSFPNNKQALRIELTRTKGQKPTVLLYHKFQVGSKAEKYKLTIDEFEGLQGYDALSDHNGFVFTVKKSMTERPDRDECSGGSLSGGWWFKKCNKANLNGRKFKSPSPIRALGITWHIEDKPESYKYIYDRVEIKIRDKDFGFCTGALKFKIL